MTTDCILWTGYVGEEGYAVGWFDGVCEAVHRYFYKKAKGPIPEGYEIDHLCKVRHCTNPDHLEAVEHYENFIRSDAPAAINKRKTHCKYGHEFTAENTHVRPNGKRDCIMCYMSKRQNPSTSKFGAKR